MKRTRKPRTEDQKAQRKLRRIDKAYSVKGGIIYFNGERIGHIYKEQS